VRSFVDNDARKAEDRDEKSRDEQH
jgi:hypothetical protein